MTTLQRVFAIPFVFLLLSAFPTKSQENRANVSLYLKPNETIPEKFVALENVTIKALDAGENNKLDLDLDIDEDAVNYDLIAPMYEEHLSRSSIIYGLVKAANYSRVNTICYRHLKNIRRGILRKEPWAMKALDASGSKPSGFVFGQNFWFGSREACGAVGRPVGITLSANFPRVMKQGIINEISPFDMDYRVIYLKHHSPWQVEIKLMSEQVIHIGLCLPSSCATPEIQDLMADYIKAGLFVENDIYDIQPDVLYMKDLRLTSEFFDRESFKLLSAAMAFTLAMILAASYLRSRSQEVAKKCLDKLDHASEQIAASRDEDDDDNNDDVGLSLKSFPEVRSFIMCFDVQSNLAKMFSIKESNATEIPVINGLRSICAVWILIFHVMWYMYFTVHNKTFLISYAEKAFFQYISSAPILVDAFFTISGFLQTYNFFRNAKKVEMIRHNTLMQNAKQFFKMFFHRYLRLVPLYLVVMAVIDLLFVYIGKVSVYDINEKFDENCGNYWWRNLFFIQNLFDHKDMCGNWTWSLACEMQYFIIATVLLFVYTKHPRFVKSLTVASLIATILWSYSIGLNTNFELSFDSFFATGTDIYISPFVRILPYIIGAAAGWAFVERGLRPTDLSEFQEKSFWNLSIFIFFVCIYSTIKRDVSHSMAITLFVVGRFLFTLAVSWAIIGSATGRSTRWSRFLEAKPFQHLNRISYAFYLLNPLVIAFFFGLTSSSTHADPFMLCVLCTGFAVIVYLASILFSLAFEMPLCNWSSHLLKRKSIKSKNA